MLKEPKIILKRLPEENILSSTKKQANIIENNQNLKKANQIKQKHPMFYINPRKKF